MSTALLWLRQAPVYALSAAQILMDVGPFNRTALADSALSEEAGSTRPGEWARAVKYHWIESGNYPGLHSES